MRGCYVENQCRKLLLYYTCIFALRAIVNLMILRYIKGVVHEKVRLSTVDRRTFSWHSLGGALGTLIYER